MQVKMDSASREDVHIWLLVCAQNSIPITQPSLPGPLICLTWNWCLLLGYQSCRNGSVLMKPYAATVQVWDSPHCSPLCILYTILWHLIFLKCPLELLSQAHYLSS